MARPVADTQLVADQPVARFRIWNPEKSLGKAHQHDAFARAQAVFMQERFDPELVATSFAHAQRQPPGALAGLHTLLGIDPRFLQQASNAAGLLATMRPADRCPPWSAAARRPILENVSVHDEHPVRWWRPLHLEARAAISLA